MTKTTFSSLKEIKTEQYEIDSVSYLKLKGVIKADDIDEEIPFEVSGIRLDNIEMLREVKYSRHTICSSNGVEMNESIESEDHFIKFKIEKLQ